jgi:hypothetical protein
MLHPRIASLAGFLAVSACAVQSLLAAPLYVQNNSFESPTEAQNNATTNVVPGFALLPGDDQNTGADVGVFYPLANAAIAPDGNQVLYMQVGNSYSDTVVPPVGVSQSLENSATDPSAYTITAGATYTLLIDVAKRGDSNNSPAGYSVFFTANGTQVGVPLTGNTSTLTPGTFVDDLSATYVATGAQAGEQLGFVIEQTSATDASSQILFDNVRINGSVPEPASAALVALALPLALRRKRAAR